MKVLSDIDHPSSEQLTIFKNYKVGFTLVRGAAGSGKTTTAVMRLNYVTKVWLEERRRLESDKPVRILVLTYNRTLRGYVAALVDKQANLEGAEVTLSTFASWARAELEWDEIFDGRRYEQRIWALGGHLGYEKGFLIDEVDYVLGRYLPVRLGDYTDQNAKEAYRRRGRGAAPRVDIGQRKRILNDVVRKYCSWKQKEGVWDWSDVALEMARIPRTEPYDIVVIDEAQDFSANQVRAVVRHLAPLHTTTFVLDAMQQIYPRGFSWLEAGVEIGSSYRLGKNFRNTRQIAAFARPLVDGLPIDDDGTLPDFNATEEEGPLPVVLRGQFSAQMDWIVEMLDRLPKDESVALLHLRGGRWLDYVRERLRRNGTDFVDITRSAEWPEGPERVALCTMYSAKGLEFDHVVIIGLNADWMPHGEEENDTQLANYRRLVAMAIGRARRSATLSFKPSEAPKKIIEYLDDETYELVDL